MHDGYLFTIGICGSASASNPAPALLDAMLAALPPVKRAALLGEVLPLAADGTLSDPLLDAVVQDIADAELLLFVTPLPPNGQLPARLEALLQRADALLPPGALAGKRAVCAGVAAPFAALDDDQALHRLARWCAAGGIDVTAIFRATENAIDPPWVARAVEDARNAYEVASAALRARGIAHAR